MTARQNIEFALRAARVPRPDWSRRIDPLLERIGLGHIASHRPEALSIGMAQRICLVRALALEPAVLLLDEPFAAVDPLQREALQLGLQEMLRDAPHTIVVIVTHDIGEALVLGDRVIVLAGRPSAPRLDLQVTAQRPRETEFRLSREFAALQREVRAALAEG
jgi:NitT/TauT family transport system ATP-binding protein